MINISWLYICILTIEVNEPQNLEIERKGSNLKNLAYHQWKIYHKYHTLERNSTMKEEDLPLHRDETLIQHL